MNAKSTSITRIFLKENGKICHYFSAVGSLMHFLQTCDKLQCGSSVSAYYYLGERRVAIFSPNIYSLLFCRYFISSPNLLDRFSSVFFVKHLLFVFFCFKIKTGNYMFSFLFLYPFNLSLHFVKNIISIISLLGCLNDNIKEWRLYSEEGGRYLCVHIPKLLPDFPFKYNFLPSFPIFGEYF